MFTIELENITKSFNHHVAVDNLSLAVPQGSIYGFIGPNGSGKTTTIRMIMNILYPDKGKIRLFGKEHYGTRLDRVGYLPEERGLYKKMKVKEVLSFHGELKHAKNLKKEITYWLQRFDLLEWENKKVETLSKGMSQKVQFIATIIDRPEIIILDEPFSGLDPVNTSVLRSSILELQEKGATIIFSTHDMNVAESMCDFIFMIHNGKKVLDGTLESIQEKYGSDTISIQTEAGMDALKDLHGIQRINDFGRLQEIRFDKEINPQLLLKTILERTMVSKFEIARPSLNDIFLRIAKPEDKEVNHA